MKMAKAILAPWTAPADTFAWAPLFCAACWTLAAGPLYGLAFGLVTAAMIMALWRSAQ